MHCIWCLWVEVLTACNQAMLSNVADADRYQSFRCKLTLYVSSILRLPWSEAEWSVGKVNSKTHLVDLARSGPETLCQPVPSI